MLEHLQLCVKARWCYCRVVDLNKQALACSTYEILSLYHTRISVLLGVMELKVTLFSTMKTLLLLSHLSADANAAKTLNIYLHSLFP